MEGEERRTADGEYMTGCSRIVLPVCCLKLLIERRKLGCTVATTDATANLNFNAKQVQ